jgi:ubiquinone biosynthesis protein
MTAAPTIVELPAHKGWDARPASRFRPRHPKPGEASRLERDEWSLTKPVRGNFFRTLARLVEILAVVSYFGVRVAFGFVFIRDRHRRRAQRALLFRQVFETLGGAFIKVGQQLSLRQDMLAIEYCDALKALLDHVKEFEFPLARKAIEEQIRRPIESVFRDLDPNPIGRASIACVYQAWLCDRHETCPIRVAIKVRRPGIVKLFAADLTALDWVAMVLEYLTIVRRGVSRNFRYQVKQILFDELDFIKEARYQEIFRRRYRKRRRYHVTAPKVFHRYSGKAVLVSEFVDAIPLESITSAIEVGDEEYLAYLRSLDIDAVRLAKRLIRSSYDAFFEGTFFHGDPHPANIMVLPHNKLVFVDFGACGTFSDRDRHLMLQMHSFHSRKDIRGMVECVVALMGSLPPMDVEEFTNKLEKEYWDGYYGLQSKHSDWRDRTSYRLWVALFDLAREYHIPLPFNLLRMIRATLLYDTIAAQLYNQIDVFKEFRKYEKDYARRVRDRLIGDVVRQALRGPDLGWYVSFKRLASIGRKAVLRLQQFLDGPLPVPIQAIADKVFFAISTATNWLVSVAFVLSGFWWFGGLPINLFMWRAWAKSHESGMAALTAMVAILTITHANALRLRFRDPDNS